MSRPEQIAATAGVARAADRLIQACIGAARITFTPDSGCARAGEALHTAYGSGDSVPADMAALLEQLGGDAPSRN
jgi:hypothetical protein